MLAANGPSTTLTEPSDGRSKGFPDGVDAQASEALAEEIRGLRETATVPRVRRTHPAGSQTATSRGLSSPEFHDFHATAYCLKGRTASGEFTRRGLIAADPRVLPIGTVVRIRAGDYTGTYTVKDTGRLIKGRKIDLYVPSYHEARQFGRQRVKLAVISRPWRGRDDRSAAAAAM